jgi:hypothetical protein
LEWVYEQEDVNAIALSTRGVNRIEDEPHHSPVHTATHYVHTTQTPSRNDLNAQIAIVPPPPEELAALYELAMMGDIRGIQQQSTRLEQLDPQFVPFAKQLRQLAKGFQEKQILEFVRKYLCQERHEC